MKIEGRNAVYELLKTDKTVDKLLAEDGLRDERRSAILALCKERKIKVQFVSRAVMQKESETGKCQGYIAYTSEFRYAELEEIMRLADEKQGLVVALAGIEDPHNLGSILRVCECAGACGVIIPQRRSVQVTDTVVRVSEGAANHVPVARVTNLNQALDELKENGFWVTGAELGGENIYASNLKGKLCIVIGGEDSGIPRLTKEKCDNVVTLPMFGSVNSLNASVACGIVLYECVRQRNNGGA
ncbi:MAG: 23S rRNA (guanosine(2251)-2'-O)-methyltransferase RlmB [Clostridia bacterium]|nr:23S rRNA (guanosine(2251)-2'-O)-methyltransferase RlmB [Clostridia bacterium]